MRSTPPPETSLASPEPAASVYQSFALQATSQTDVCFYSSLEDLLFRKFGSDRYSEVLKALSKGSTAPMTGSQISRAIRAAQKKVKKRAMGDQRVTSAEDWFTYNMPV
jgi:hypothetical protein